MAGVDLEIEAGELLGLIGPNGAGKTTFIDAITGFVRSEGTVERGDTTMNGLPPHVRAQRGLGAVIAQGTPAEIRGDERVVAAYLGHASAGTEGAA